MGHLQAYKPESRADRSVADSFPEGAERGAQTSDLEMWLRLVDGARDERSAGRRQIKIEE